MIPKEHIEKAKNIISALNRATFDGFKGEEVWALTRDLSWFTQFVGESMRAAAQQVAPPQVSSTPKDVAQVTKLDPTKKKK